MNFFATMTPLTIALFALAHTLVVGGIIYLGVALYTTRRPHVAGWPMVAGIFVLAAAVASHAFL